MQPARIRAWNGTVPADLSEKRRRAGRLGAAARWGNKQSANPDSNPGSNPTRPRPVPDRQWYRIDNSAATAEVWIYDEIGYWGVTASDFVTELQEITAPNLTVHLNTPGGDVFDGIAIYNALLNHPAAVTTIVDALAASAGSFIAQAGDRRVMGRNSQMMIHEAGGLCIGTAADMRELADLLDRHSDNIAAIYNDRASGGGARSLKAWRKAMQAESWYSADEAVAAGLADEVAALPAREENRALEAVAQWDLSVFRYAGRNQAPDPDIDEAEDDDPEDPADPGGEAPTPTPAEAPDDAVVADIHYDPDAFRNAIALGAAEVIHYDPDIFRAAVELAVAEMPAPPAPEPQPAPASTIDINTFTQALTTALKEAP